MTQSSFPAITFWYEFPFKCSTFYEWIGLSNFYDLKCFGAFPFLKSSIN